MNTEVKTLLRFARILVQSLEALEALDGTTAAAPVKKPVKAAPAAAPIAKARGRRRKELTRSEAADYLDVHELTVKAMAERGDIPMGHKKEGAGMKHFYFQNDLEAFRKAQRIKVKLNGNAEA